MSDAAPYNPLDKTNLGASVADALLGRKPRKLHGLKRFDGVGIYALYYCGGFAPYQRLASLNQGDDPQAPIYVGKAIPEGARKGGVGTAPSSSTALYRRLKEHADSIQASANLDIADFVCRFLTVDDIWIPLGESLLIAKFSPLWNTTIDGFGNHDPGKGRYKGMAPRWDVLHPGRAWATRCEPRTETAEQIAGEVAAWLAHEPSLVRSRFHAEDRKARYRVQAEDDTAD
jgi:hypothetical protein